MKKYILSLFVGLVVILPTISLTQEWVARYNGFTEKKKLILIK